MIFLIDRLYSSVAFRDTMKLYRKLYRDIEGKQGEKNVEAAERDSKGNVATSEENQAFERRSIIPSSFGVMRTKVTLSRAILNAKRCGPVLLMRDSIAIAGYRFLTFDSYCNRSREPLRGGIPSK